MSQAVVGVVVVLLAVAAFCGLLAIRALLADLLEARSRAAVLVQPPSLPVPVLVAAPFSPRPLVPAGPPLPAPVPRGALSRGTPAPGHRDDFADDDYTEVDEGVTVIRDPRLPLRR